MLLWAVKASKNDQHILDTVLSLVVSFVLPGTVNPVPGLTSLRYWPQACIKLPQWTWEEVQCQLQC